MGAPFKPTGLPDGKFAQLETLFGNTSWLGEKMSAEGKKYLVALDFDHTVIEDNSDMYVQQLAPDGKIPEKINKLYEVDGWTDYMAAIFKHLHKGGVTPAQIEQCMQQILLVDGMHDLFKFFQQQGIDVIIVSDANSLFIDVITKKQGLTDTLKEVFTNPAKFDDEGCLTIKFYHEQDWCKLSSKNLCKGHILDEYITKRAKEGVRYDKVAFVGDGSNDLCPMLRLRSQDLACARKNFRLQKILARGTEEELKAKVLIWENGKDLLASFRKYFKP